jgi:hypothetical protein
MLRGGSRRKEAVFPKVDTVIFIIGSKIVKRKFIFQNENCT